MSTAELLETVKVTLFQNHEKGEKRKLENDRWRVLPSVAWEKLEWEVGRDRVFIHGIFWYFIFLVKKNLNMTRNSLIWSY